MVFSQTSHKTQNLIQVVELDRLKAEKNQQVDASAAVDSEQAMASPRTDSFSEIFLKSEPLYENTMIQDMDFEFFQNLPSFIIEPTHQLQTNSLKKIETETHHTDTLNTPLSPQSWEIFDTNSPSIQASLYNNVTNDPLSPIADGFTGFDAKFLNTLENENLIQGPEQFLDINSLPVVIGDLASEVVDRSSWQPTKPIDWTYTADTDHTKSVTLNNVPFINDDDSQDWKYMASVVPREVENNNVIIEEYIINENVKVDGGRGLSVDVSSAPSWHTDIVNTPDVLRTVEQLEKQKFPIDTSTPNNLWPPDDSGFVTTESVLPTTPVDYEPITPKSESHVETDNEDAKSSRDTRRRRRRRHDSEESDETYTPYSEATPRKCKPRKSSVPLVERIRALEGSQQLPKARRGRPPKRRESTVSSVCSVDENSSSISTQEVKYRELRDKNNEASKRSRMNRKLKELQMEQLADDLEEQNKRLKVKADILEDMTKRLKTALMSAIIQK